MPVNWNPWHGCHKLSAGCANCYVYRGDARYGRGDSSLVRQTQDFSLPVRRARDGSYKIASGTLVWCCFTSDFLLKDADCWRPECWRMMKERSDLTFLFITKRIDRLAFCLPDDWGAGYDNVHVCCTAENQETADYRLPIFLRAPIKRKMVVCEPLLSAIDLTPYLTPQIRSVVVGGESGPLARVCDYNWVLDIRRQCIAANITFRFKQTGARLLKDGRVYNIKRSLQHQQARKAGINFTAKKRAL